MGGQVVGLGLGAGAAVLESVVPALSHPPAPGNWSPGGTGKADKLAAGGATQWEAQKARGGPVPSELRWAPSEAS